MTRHRIYTIGKQIVSTIICLCIVISLVVPITAKAAEQEFYTNTLGYRKMETDAQRSAYIKIAKMILSYNREGLVFGPEDGVTRNEIANILRYIPYDYPDAFYFRGSCSLAELDGTVFIVPLYTTNTSSNLSVNEKNAVIADQREQFEAAVTRVINNIPSYIDTDEEKSKYIFEYLAANVKYEDGDHDQTAYGALVERKCVCAGYAAAYTVLMRKLGVNTWMVTGEADNGEYTGPHAWNVSWINGKCVYTDPTWGDGETKVRYKYLNISGKKMNENHTWDAVYDSVLYECDHNLQGTIIPAIKVTGVILNSANKELTKKGQTWQIEASVVPTNAANKKLTYFSDNKDVATVSGSGLVTAVGEGEAKITIKSDDGGALATVAVTVVYPHEHSLRKVSRKAPTCTEPGNEEYYICDGCSTMFQDASGKVKLTDITQVAIKELGHKTGEMRHDEQKHWVCCENCSMVSRLRDHSFDDTGKCDTCGYQSDMPVNNTTEPDPPTSAPATTEPAPLPTEAKEDITDTSNSDEHAEGEGLTASASFAKTLAIAAAIIPVVACIAGVFLLIILIPPKNKK